MSENDSSRFRSAIAESSRSFRARDAATSGATGLPASWRVCSRESGSESAFATRCRRCASPYSRLAAAATSVFRCCRPLRTSSWMSSDTAWRIASRRAAAASAAASCARTWSGEAATPPPRAAAAAASSVVTPKTDCWPSYGRRYVLSIRGRFSSAALRGVGVLGAGVFGAGVRSDGVLRMVPRRPTTTLQTP